MGKGQTPARVRAVLLPPRPAPRVDPVVDRTELRARAESSPPVAVFPAAVFPAAVFPAAVFPAAVLPGVVQQGVVQEVGQPLVAPAMAAAASVMSPAPEGALPPVAPKPLDPMLQPVPRHLLDCRVSVIPRLPVVNLEKPNSNWPDLTPSPVPRVSLVPPTGRLEPAQLRSAPEARSLPTVAPRSRALGAAPGYTVPRLSKPAPNGWLSRRIARDLRSSKREIAFGLGIGIGLSFVLGKLGQTYLESRSATRGGAIDSWTGSAMPSAEPRAPRGNLALPAAAAPSSAVRNAGVPNAAVPSTGTPAPPAAPAVVGAAALAAPAAAVPAAPAALTASPQSAPAKLATPLGGALAPPKPRSTKAAHRQAPASRPNDGELGSPDESTADELEPRGKAPLSPSESAGLGRELPL